MGTRVIRGAGGAAATTPDDAGHQGEQPDEEPLFLDEPATEGPRPPASDSSVFDLFADENDHAPALVPAPDSIAGRSGAPPVVLASPRAPHAARARMPRARIVALFLIAAALAFAGVRACQISAEVSRVGTDINPSATQPAM